LPNISRVLSDIQEMVTTWNRGSQCNYSQYPTPFAASLCTGAALMTNSENAVTVFRW